AASAARSSRTPRLCTWPAESNESSFFFVFFFFLSLSRVQYSIVGDVVKGRDMHVLVDEAAVVLLLHGVLVERRVGKGDVVLDGAAEVVDRGKVELGANVAEHDAVQLGAVKVLGVRVQNVHLHRLVLVLKVR